MKADDVQAGLNVFFNAIEGLPLRQKAKLVLAVCRITEKAAYHPGFVKFAVENQDLKFLSEEGKALREELQVDSGGLWDPSKEEVSNVK